MRIPDARKESYKPFMVEPVCLLIIPTYSLCICGWFVPADLVERREQGHLPFQEAALSLGQRDSADITCFPKHCRSPGGFMCFAPQQMIYVGESWGQHFPW